MTFFTLEFFDSEGHPIGSAFASDDLGIVVNLAVDLTKDHPTAIARVINSDTGEMLTFSNGVPVGVSMRVDSDVYALKTDDGKETFRRQDCWN